MKRKLKLILNSTLVLGFLLFLHACKKNSLTEEKLQAPNPSLVFKTPSTPQEKLLVENLKKVTSIFKLLYKDKNNLKEVNAAILSKTYSDESVLIEDLIYFENSRISKNKRFNDLCLKKNITGGNFAQNFWKEVAKLKDPSFQTFLSNIKNSQNGRLDEYNGLNELTVYFPYSENYNFTSDPIPTVTTATADADEGWGEKSYYDINGILQWTQVLVNDDYAFDNPTQIIGLNGIEPLEYVSDILLHLHLRLHPLV
ncbi:MAG TPA: hypothetical protein VMY77_10735 [Chitinophagaceae bacterium]|nr:hypothetical protein [Chitinophagaceae bacterium]